MSHRLQGIFNARHCANQIDKHEMLSNKYGICNHINPWLPVHGMYGWEW